jgi:hypothetical protein
MNSVSVWDHMKAVEMDNDNGCSTLWMYLMTLNCIPNNGKNGIFYILPLPQQAVL